MGPVSTTQTQSEHRDEFHSSLRRCPSLPDSQEALFVHRIGVEQCGQRREQHYHRCFRCLHKDGCPSSRGGQH